MAVLQQIILDKINGTPEHTLARSHANFGLLVKFNRAFPVGNMEALGAPIVERTEAPDTSGSIISHDKVAGVLGDYNSNRICSIFRKGRVRIKTLPLMNPPPQDDDIGKKVFSAMAGYCTRALGGVSTTTVYTYSTFFQWESGEWIDRGRLPFIHAQFAGSYAGVVSAVATAAEFNALVENNAPLRGNGVIVTEDISSGITKTSAVNVLIGSAVKGSIYGYGGTSNPHWLHRGDINDLMGIDTYGDITIGNSLPSNPSDDDILFSTTPITIITDNPGSDEDTGFGKILDYGKDYFYVDINLPQR